MIRIVTGLPGAGKSLRGVQHIVEAIKTGRPIFVHGIDGLRDDLGWQSCDPNDWQSLPDGSLVVVDEAQKVWPQRRTGDPPAHIRALSEHRHRGFDFVLLTQHPTMLDKYVRTLCGEHQHVLRQFGTGLAKIITWTECHDDPQQLSTRQRGTEAYWKYPKECFPLYKSATMHTVKTRVPARLVVLPFAVIVGAAAVWWGVKSFGSIGADPASATASMVAAPGMPLSSSGGSREAKPRFTSDADFIAAHKPRVTTMPWSARVFDDRKPLAEPDLYCIAYEDASKCLCNTEQGTRYEISRRECMLIVRNGLYNPYRRPLIQQENERAAPGRLADPPQPSTASREDRPPIAHRDTPREPRQGGFPQLADHMR